MESLQDVEAHHTTVRGEYVQTSVPTPLGAARNERFFPPSVHADFHNPFSLDHRLVEDGLKFIRRRFSEVWGIHRFDIDHGAIFSRANARLVSGSSVRGWLGLERDGELTNACIDAGLRGVQLLQSLIEEIYANTSLNYYYADVPICRYGSARAFLMTGMKLSDPLLLTNKVYPEKHVALVRLEFHRADNRKVESEPGYIESSLLKITEVWKNAPTYPAIAKSSDN